MLSTETQIQQGLQVGRIGDDENCNDRLGQGIINRGSEINCYRQCLDRVRTLIKHNQISQAIGEVNKLNLGQQLFQSNNTKIAVKYNIQSQKQKQQQKQVATSPLLSTSEQENTMEVELQLLFCLATCLLTVKEYKKCLDVLVYLRERISGCIESSCVDYEMIRAGKNKNNNQVSYSQMHKKQLKVTLMISICYSHLHQYTDALLIIDNALTLSNHQIKNKNSQNNEQDLVDLMFMKYKLMKQTKQYSNAQMIIKQLFSMLSQHSKQGKTKRQYMYSIQLIRTYELQHKYQQVVEFIDSWITATKKKLDQDQRQSHQQSQKQYQSGQIVYSIINKPYLNTSRQEQLMLFKKLQALYKLQLYQQCLIDLNQLQLNIFKSEMTISGHKQFANTNNKMKRNYMRGKLYLKLNKYQQGILCFNQILQSTQPQHTHYIKLSLIQLILHFLKQRDYYEASVYAKMKIHLFTSKQTIPQIQHLSLLAQGLILLMKKNTLQALEILSKINLEAFQKYVQKTDQQFIKNLLLNSEGYALFTQGKHQQALAKYQMVNLNQNDQAYCSILYNKEILKGILTAKRQVFKNYQEIMCLQHFQKAAEYLSRPEPYFYMAVVMAQKCLLQDQYKLQDILNTLKTGLNIGESAQMLYYRALVYISLDMNLQAMQDLQKAIQISQDNVAGHFYAKGLVYQLEQNYQQAIAQFDVGLSIDDSHAQSILQRAKCCLMSGNSLEAYGSLKLYKQVSDDSRLWELYFMLYERKYKEIVQLLAGVEGISEESEKFSYDNNFMFPTKTTTNQQNTEIQQILQASKLMLGEFEDSGAGGKLILGVLYGSLQQVLVLLQEALQLGIDVGVITARQLLYMKGYVLFRLQKYAQALELFEHVQTNGLEMINMNANKNNTISQQDYKNFQHEQYPINNNAQTEQIGILTVKMDIIYCLLALGRYQQSVDRLQSLMEDVNEGEVLDDLMRLRDVVVGVMNHMNGNYEFFDSRVNVEGKADQQQSKYSVKITILQIYQLLSHYFPTLTVTSPLNNSRTEIEFKLLIPFPIIRIPQLQPNRHRLLQGFRLEEVQNKPQPPWIKRGSHGLIFTSQVRESSNLKIDTEQYEHQIVGNQDNNLENINSNVKDPGQTTHKNNSIKFSLKQNILDDLKLPSSLVLKLQKLTMTHNNNNNQNKS